MNYQQFIVEVKEKVTQLLDENLHVQVHTALKNNGQERIGLGKCPFHTLYDWLLHFFVSGGCDRLI